MMKTKTVENDLGWDKEVSSRYLLSGVVLFGLGCVSFLVSWTTSYFNLRDVEAMGLTMTTQGFGILALLLMVVPFSIYFSRAIGKGEIAPTIMIGATCALTVLLVAFEVAIPKIMKGMLYVASTGVKTITILESDLKGTWVSEEDARTTYEFRSVRTGLFSWRQTVVVTGADTREAVGAGGRGAVIHQGGEWELSDRLTLFFTPSSDTRVYDVKLISWKPWVVELKSGGKAFRLLKQA